MGPGLAAKALFGRYFSLTVFGFSQVAIDLEPLVRILRGDTVLHGFTHTWIGATPVALASLAFGRPVCQYLLDNWRPDPNAAFLNWLRGPERISWPAAIAGAFGGTYSHVFLDGIMHSDMRPLAPLSDANSMLHIIPVGSLHLACVLSGVLAALLLLAMFILRRGARAGRQG
jgi:hypothetical protein